MNIDRYRVFRFFLAVASLWLSGANALAGSGNEQLQQFLQNLRTLSAQFEQSMQESGQTESPLARGTFYLQRPGRLRWEYAVPDQLIVADGKRIWLYDKELEQILHRSQKDAFRGTPAQLLSDVGALDEQFQISEMGHSNGYDWVELIPHDQDSEFNRILLAFAQNELRQMDIADNFGQVTRLRFFQMVRNPQLAAELFEFNPPSGIDLISE